MLDHTNRDFDRRRNHRSDLLDNAIRWTSEALTVCTILSHRWQRCHDQGHQNQQKPSHFSNSVEE
jgi:hypothetical protein